ncbi:MAG: GNAT family N-acetyltransferase [Rhodothermales bacterium]|nr:GNAT family N-acetyltransferase [Rhodothermales bacterium]
MPAPPPFHPAFLDPAAADVRTAWAALLERSEQRTPFSTLAYAETAAGAFGLRVRLAAAEDADGDLAAGVVVFERRRGPYRTVVVPPQTPYTPFVLAEPLREAEINARRSALDALLPLLDRAYHALAFHLHPSSEDVRPFTWAGYTARPRYTHRDELAAPDGLLARASKAVRKGLRRDADAYVLREDPAALPALAALLDRVFERQEEAPPLDRATRAALIEPLFRAGLARLFTATPAGGEPEGALVVLSDGHSAHHWIGGSAPGPAMTLLTHHARGVLHAEGVCHFDFGGANLPSVAEFKRRFGAPLVRYVRVERVRRPELRALALVRPFL